MADAAAGRTFQLLAMQNITQGMLRTPWVGSEPCEAGQLSREQRAGVGAPAGGIAAAVVGSARSLAIRRAYAAGQTHWLLAVVRVPPNQTMRSVGLGP